MDSGLPDSLFVPIAIGVALMVALLIAPFILGYWARRVRAHETKPGWRYIRVLPWVGFGAVVTGMTLSVVALVRTLREVPHLDPSEKGAFLAAGAAASMPPTFIGMALAWLLYAVTGGLLVLATVRRTR